MFCKATVKEDQRHSVLAIWLEQRHFHPFLLRFTVTGIRCLWQRLSHFIVPSLFAFYISLGGGKEGVAFETINQWFQACILIWLLCPNYFIFLRLRFRLGNNKRPSDKFKACIFVASAACIRLNNFLLATLTRFRLTSEAILRFTLVF